MIVEAVLSSSATVLFAAAAEYALEVAGQGIVKGAFLLDCTYCDRK